MDVTCWIVTGWRGAGKTSFCQEVIQYARQQNWDAAGLLSVSYLTDGIRTAIDAVNIRSGERQRLASLQQQSASDQPYSRWFFNPATVKWGNQVMVESVPCDLLVVDELGPLEFNQGAGWVSAFDVVRSRAYRLAVVVIRPELLEQASQRFAPARVIQLASAVDVKPVLEQVKPEVDLMMGLGK